MVSGYAMLDTASELEAAFAYFDKDGSGTLNAEELSSVLQSVGEKMSAEDVTEMMKEADINGDGEIDYKGKLMIGLYILKVLK